ncbi:MAG: SOS response-associated peptidase [Vallitaleaceae bacterium]|jgi:putative SOS response-associated peptidase YedK|nr:SOS response-associated peptidase [Vallitaleaceae bacterium]
MCGRVTLEFDIDTIRDMLKDVYNVSDAKIHDFKPSYNMPPSSQLISIISDQGVLRAGTLKWGLVPNWTKDEKIGNKLTIARAETIHEKPSFKESYETRRCLIVISGYYEWDTLHNTKQPYYFTLKEQPLMTLAGIWSTYIKSPTTKIHTCAIVTTVANPKSALIHNRMPVILSDTQMDTWLHGTKESRTQLMKPYDGVISMKAVSTIVNSVYNDGPMLIEDIA